MKHQKMIIVFTLIIAFVLLFTGCSMADHTALKWGMNVKDVEKTMGKPIKEIRTVDSIAYYSCSGVKISKYKTDMSFSFLDGCLIGKSVRIDDPNQKVFKYLRNSLKIKYGEPIIISSKWNRNMNLPNEDVELACKIYWGPDHGDLNNQKSVLREVANGAFSFVVWEPDEDTYLLLFNMENGGLGDNTLLKYNSQTYVLQSDTDGL